MNIKKDSLPETILETPLENKTPDTNRRKALKIAAGGGLLSGAALTNGVWTKPVIDTVLLPAHAQTSMMMTFSANGTITTTTPTLDRDSILDLFVTPVHAGSSRPSSSLVGFQAYAMQTGEDAFDFQFLLEASQDCKVFDKGQLTTENSIVAFIEVSASGGSGMIPRQLVCPDPMVGLVLRSSITGDFTYQVDGANLNVIANFSGFMFDLDNFEFSMAEGGAPLVDPGCTFCPQLPAGNGNGAGSNGNGAGPNGNGAGPNGNGAGLPQ